MYGYHGISEAERDAHSKYLAESGIREDDCWQSVQERRNRRVPSGVTADLQNVPRAREDVITFGPMAGWNECTQTWDCAFLQIQDETEEEVRYAAFLLYLDTHVA